MIYGWLDLFGRMLNLWCFRLGWWFVCDWLAAVCVCLLPLVDFV